MEVEIIEVKPGEQYTINGKEVYKDTEGNWMAREIMTTNEVQAFRIYRAQNDIE